MTTAEPDEALVAKAQADPAAFGALYERYVGVVYSYVYYRVRNVHEAEDLTSRVFYQALTHLDRYVSRGAPFAAWLFRIAHNLVANWYREQRNRQTFPLDDALLEHESRQGEDVRQAVDDREDARELRAFMVRLAPDRQQLIVLKYAEGMSNTEIATIMGRSEGAVKALLHRTLMQLRAELDRSNALERAHSS